MKIKVKSEELPENPYIFLKHLGWGQILDRKSNNYSLVKRLSQNYYPRLHLYIKEIKDGYIFDNTLIEKNTVIKDFILMIVNMKMSSWRKRKKK